MLKRAIIPSRFVIYAVVLTVVSLGLGCTSSKARTTYSLYFLGGQSNMDGYGYVGELPAELNAPVSGVRIFHGNSLPDDSSGGGLGIWSELQPGHGVGFTYDGTANSYSERFGVELTFGLSLREMTPDANIAIIKYSRGGTSIDAKAARDFGSWDPGYDDGAGVNQFDHFIETVQNAMAETDIDGDGRADTLVPSGIIWMQGESDGDVSQEIAERYLENLTELMGLIRDTFGAEEMPVVIGRISDSGQDEETGVVWEFGDVVRAAQAAYVEGDGFAALVTSTDEYGYSDRWHYDTEGYIDLGRKFAEAVVGVGGER